MRSLVLPLYHRTGSQAEQEDCVLTIDYKIDLGHILTASVLVLGFAVQYGILSNRVTVVETQVARAQVTNESLLITLNSLQQTIIKVQTQMDEREKRFDAAQADQNLRQDKRDMRMSR
jgi:hypothetical protein